MTVKYSSVRQLLSKGDRALVIFTDRREHRSKASGKGNTSTRVDMTSSWRINAARLNRVNCVILYVRDRATNTGAELVRCRRGAHVRHGDGRHTLKLFDLQPMGTTASNWNEFAETGAYPLRYFPD